MSSEYGKNIKISIFGQSHAPEIGVTIDGLPAGFTIDIDELRAFLKRRAPGQGAHTTARREADEPEFNSGLVDGVTSGAPLTAIIRNTDVRSSDYDDIKDVPRPSHADYTAHIKYGELHDFRGGGQFSGRMTAPLCLAGGIVIQLLRLKGIEIAAHIGQIGGIADQPFDPACVGQDEFDILRSAAFPVIDKYAGERMLASIEEARKDGDSLGGIIECAIIGMPAGIGEPIFGGMENKIASILFAVPAVKGVEFGNGFAAANLRGSENNDAFVITENTTGTGEPVKTVKTLTNRHGGFLGGITSGMPIVFRAAFKPTPSISKEQDSVSLSKMENVKLTIMGRHDPCVVPRAVPCIEAAAAIAVYDALQDPPLEAESLGLAP